MHICSWAGFVFVSSLSLLACSQASGIKHLPVLHIQMKYCQAALATATSLIDRFGDSCAFLRALSGATDFEAGLARHPLLLRMMRDPFENHHLRTSLQVLAC